MKMKRTADAALTTEKLLSQTVAAAAMYYQFSVIVSPSQTEHDIRR